MNPVDIAPDHRYAHTMSTYTAHETTIYGGYGEFDPYGTDSWTELDWQRYDDFIASEIEQFEASQDEDDFWPSPEDFHAPF